MQSKKCGAKTRNGKQCEAYAMDNGRCRMHGGKSLAGVDSPSFKTGEYSKYMPKRLSERYASDIHMPPDNSVPRRMLDEMIAEHAETIAESGVNLEFIKHSRRHALDSLAAFESDNYAALHKLLIEYVDYTGSTDTTYFEAQRQLIGALEARRKLLDSDSKNVARVEQITQSKEFMLLAAAMFQVASEFIKDAREQQRFSERVIEVIPALLEDRN